MPVNRGDLIDARRKALDISTADARAQPHSRRFLPDMERAVA